MKIWQIKEISPNTYKTFGDELKLKMIKQQFAFPSEHLNEVRKWLIENINDPYVIDSVEPKDKHAWIKFVNKEDATAFKLRWS